MLEVYIFDNINNFNQEFQDKLHNGYCPHKITFHLDKQINNLDDILFKYIYELVSFNDIFPLLYYDSIEFINNKISYTVSSINMVEYQLSEKIMININEFRCSDIIPNYKIISVDVEILKHDFMLIWRSLDYNIFLFNDYGKYVIKSDCFETFDELIKFIMYDSGMNYELSKKYLSERSGIQVYYKHNNELEKDLQEDYFNNFVILSKGENDEQNDDIDYN